MSICVNRQANALQGDPACSGGPHTQLPQGCVTPPLSSIAQPAPSMYTPTHIPHLQPPNSNVNVDELPYSYKLYLHPVDALVCSESSFDPPALLFAHRAGSPMSGARCTSGSWASTRDMPSWRFDFAQSAGFDQQPSHAIQSGGSLSLFLCSRT